MAITEYGGSFRRDDAIARWRARTGEGAKRLAQAAAQRFSRPQADDRSQIGTHGIPNEPQAGGLNAAVNNNGGKDLTPHKEVLPEDEERKKAAERWRGAKTKRQGYDPQTRFNSYDEECVISQPGEILWVDYPEDESETDESKRWQPVMATAERPYARATMRKLFDHYRQMLRNLRVGQIVPPRVLIAGGGMGFNFEAALNEAGSTDGAHIVIKELNAEIARDLTKVIKEKLRAYKPAHPDAPVDVILIETDAYTAFDRFAEAIRDGEGIIPDSDFIAVHRFTSRSEPVNARNLPIVAEPFDIADIDLFPIEPQKDKGGKDNVRKAGPIRELLHDYGLGALYGYYPGIKGRYDHEQLAILDNHGFIVHTDEDVRVCSPVEYPYLSDAEGNSIPSLTPLYIEKKQNWVRRGN